MEDIRWQQRYQNFDRALFKLATALASGPAALSLLEKEGVAQRFEYTFGLAWKTLKDYLEFQGVAIDPVTPRQVIKEAFRAGLLEDGNAWISMLEHRNSLTHEYDEDTFEKAVDAIHSRHLAALEAARAWLQARLNP
jgi:nucleotidyltransferase substrate binding protein (TIGR01987 family)